VTKATAKNTAKNTAENETVTFSTFEIADHLKNETVIAEYLSLAAQDSNSDVLLMSLADVAKARGMAQVAKDAGLGRESLYKALRQGSKPQFATIAAVMRALNVKIEVVAK
jgi:probable addiction module antidote protein